MGAIAILLLSCAGLAQPAPSPPELDYLHAVIPLIQQRSWADAESKLKLGMEEFPRSALLSNSLGMLYEQQGHFTEAARQYQLALHWLPSFTAARIHLATIKAREGECTQASELFNTAAGAVADTGALAAIGEGLGECQDYRSAAQVFMKAHRLDPASPATTYNLALAQFRSGAFEQALATLDDLPPGIERERLETLYLRGRALDGLHRPGAGETLANACRAHPQEDYCAAVRLLREDRAREAADLLESAAALVKPSAAMLTTQGLVEFRLGRYELAMASYDRAIRLDPMFAAPCEGLAFLLYMTGDLERARAVVEDALKASEPNFYLPYLRALILWRTSHRLEADALASAADSIARNPRFAPAYFLRGKIRMAANNLDSALADFQLAAGLDENFALPWYKMAQIYYRQGRPEEAKNAERRFSALGSMRKEEALTHEAQDAIAPLAQ